MGTIGTSSGHIYNQYRTKEDLDIHTKLYSKLNDIVNVTAYYDAVTSVPSMPKKEEPTP